MTPSERGQALPSPWAFQHLRLWPWAGQGPCPVSITQTGSLKHIFSFPNAIKCLPQPTVPTPPRLAGLWEMDELRKQTKLIVSHSPSIWGIYSGTIWQVILGGEHTGVAVGVVDGHLHRVSSLVRLYVFKFPSIYLLEEPQKAFRIFPFRWFSSSLSWELVGFPLGWISIANDGWPAMLYIIRGKPLSRFIERMFLQHREIFLMKNGTHYSLKDTDWLIFFINYSVCFQLFSISSRLCSHFPGLKPMCFMEEVCFYILIGNIILRFGTLTSPFQHNLPKINGETPPFRLWQGPSSPLLGWPLWGVLVFFGQANILNGDFFLTASTHLLHHKIKID